MDVEGIPKELERIVPFTQEAEAFLLVVQGDLSVHGLGQKKLLLEKIKGQIKSPLFPRLGKGGLVLQAIQRAQKGLFRNN
jgi:hypothetical protein